MVNILLGILKIIGILLAVLLSLIVLALLIVLLGPVCYRASGQYRDRKTCSASVSWLGFVLRAKADYEKDKGLFWGVRLFGILIASNEEEFIRKKEEKNRVKEEKQRKKALKEQAAESVEQAECVSHIETLGQPEEEHALETLGNPEKETKTENLENPEEVSDAESKPFSEEILVEGLEVQETEDEKKEPCPEPLEAEKEDTHPITKKKFSQTIKEKLAQIKITIINLIQKIKAIPDKIRTLIGNIKNKIETIKSKIARLMEFKEFFLGERNKEGFLHVLKNLKKMALHILPRKLEGCVEFGVEDPYVMGQILTVLSIFYPVYQDKFHIHPDFENPGFAGEASLKGRIIPGYLVLRLLIAICNREVIRIIKEGRQLFESK